MTPLRNYTFCVAACGVFATDTAFAQLTVNANVTPWQLANTIVGAGFDVKNVVLNCPPGAIGLFNGAASNINIANGILLTTGTVQKAVGPNNSASDGFNNGAAGDNDLDLLSGATTYDACVLEFDLIPYCDTLRIRYVFGSEEYPEFVDREFNDVFAFFVSGPGITGLQNIALVPGTALPVSINNINTGVNQFYYVTNTPGPTVEYDGFTVPLEGKIAVQPCMTYHLKIAIADVSDGIFDSGIFIESNSVQCSPFVYNDVATNADGVEGCTDGSFTFCRTGDLGTPLTVSYEIAGTATNGVDYVQIPDSVIIPAGQSCATVQITPLQDSDPEVVETIRIRYRKGACPEKDSLEILISDPITIDIGPDVNFCSGDAVPIGTPLDPSYTYSWSPASGISNTGIPNPIISLSISGTTPVTFTYVLIATSPDGCVLTDSLRVTVFPPPTAAFSVPPSCTSTPVTFTDLSTTWGGSIVSRLWDFGDNFFDTIANPSHIYAQPGTYTIGLTVTDNNGCTGQTTGTVDIWSLPQVSFSVNEPCVGDTSYFTSTTTFADPGDNIGSAVWDFGDGSPPVTGINAGHLYAAAGTYQVRLSVTSSRGCTNSAMRTVIIRSKPVVSFLAGNACAGTPVKFFNQSTDLTGGYWVWDFGDGSTTDALNPVYSYGGEGTYTVTLTVTSYYGCSDSATQQVTIFPKPTAQFRMDSIEGCAPLCLNFSDGSGGPNIDNWSWLLGGDVLFGNNVMYCFDDTGSFSPGLIVTTADGCRDTVYKTNRITVYPAPDAGFFTEPSVVTEIAPIVYITDLSTGGTIWIWNFGDGTHDSTTFHVNPNHTYNGVGSYRIEQVVINEFGCTDTFLRVVHVKAISTVYIPNAFTPNKDGVNEGFIPKASGEFLEADFRMYIIDRWGNTVFESKSLDQPWDGIVYRNSGKAAGRHVAQEDVYLYIARFFRKDTKDMIREMRGSVTVIK